MRTQTRREKKLSCCWTQERTNYSLVWFGSDLFKQVIENFLCVDLRHFLLSHLSKGGKTCFDNGNYCTLQSLDLTLSSYLLYFGMVFP